MSNKPANPALAALHQAIEIEVKGQEFYTKAAERTSNPKGAAMFRSLAADEVLHERILRRQLEALKRGESWIAPPGVAEVQADLSTPLFPEGEEEFQKAVHPEDSDLDALLFALQIENESYNLYRELAQATEDPNGRRMYEYLAAAERGHFDQLMLSYEHLLATGSWAD